VKRIRFIKRAQALGFTLEDVAGLLQLNDSDACAKTRDLAARKLALIEQKISELRNMRDALCKLVGQCERKAKRDTCPIIEILQLESPVAPSVSQSILHYDPRSAIRATTSSRTPCVSRQSR
jgi:MerR family mercuric resistance operon transcriptional regulator